MGYLSSVVAAYHLEILGLKLTFIATHFINLECDMFHLLGPDIHAVHPATTLTLLLMFATAKATKRVGVHFKTKQKMKCVDKCLLRMKIVLLLSEWWQSDNMIKYKTRDTNRKVKRQGLGLNQQQQNPRTCACTKSMLRSIRSKVWLHSYIVVQAGYRVYQCGTPPDCYLLHQQ
jgi:hypothetical protein